MKTLGDDIQLDEILKAVSEKKTTTFLASANQVGLTTEDIQASLKSSNRNYFTTQTIILNKPTTTSVENKLNTWDNIVYSTAANGGEIWYFANENGDEIESVTIQFPPVNPA